MNCNKGKSEILFRFSGKGATDARRHLFVELQGKVPFYADGVQYSLKACATYKHVGSTLGTTVSMQPEITLRTKGLLSTLACLRKPFFNNDGVPIKARTQILVVVLLSRGLFIAGTWPELTVAELSRLHTAVMKAYIGVTGVPVQQAQMMSYDVLCEKYELIAPINLVFEAPGFSICSHSVSRSAMASTASCTW